jgi:hypothetical protein
MQGHYERYTAKHTIGSRVAQKLRPWEKGTIIGYSYRRESQRCYMIRWDRRSTGCGWDDFDLVPA